MSHISSSLLLTFHCIPEGVRYDERWPENFTAVAVVAGTSFCREQRNEAEVGLQGERKGEEMSSHNRRTEKELCFVFLRFSLTLSLALVCFVPSDLFFDSRVLRLDGFVACRRTKAMV
ncbi:hypothetical protein VNO77_16428 [Canavalia gladiata]|uniref:Transmembrane protein n=1 Tax=Canavalia gladiata TaxID=3824 RepID=A0AAN9QT30_CANGL